MFSWRRREDDRLLATDRVPDRWKLSVARVQPAQLACRHGAVFFSGSCRFDHWVLAAGETLMLLFPLEPEIVAMARVSIARDQILEVFAKWRSYHERAFSRPTPQLKEWTKIKLRFEEGYTVEQLCRAIDGIHKSPWHLGENPGGTRYVSLELCLRDAKHVEQFLEIANQPQQPVLSEKTKRNVRALESWAQRGGDDGRLTQ
jgi:hypothetical protein